MNDDAKRRPPHPLKLLRLVWRSGGTTERRLISAVLFVASSALVFPLLAMLLSLPRDETQQVGLAMIVDFGTIILLLPAVSDPTLSVGYYEALDAGGWLAPQEREYVRELARYMKSFGEEAQIPGSTKWAVLYLVLVLGMNIGSLVFVLAFYSRLGDWTVPTFSVFQIPLAVACALRYRRRSERTWKAPRREASAWPSSDEQWDRGVAVSGNQNPANRAMVRQSGRVPA